MKRFFVKSAFGHFNIIDRNTNKIVVCYSKKSNADKTTNGLNRIRNAKNVTKMKAKLKTMKGYGYYLK